MANAIANGPLTNFYNRRALQQYTQRQNDVLLMLDIDYFKSINDQFGHEMGDSILISLTQHLAAMLRRK
ncbi:diguanylate cyclase domain-containing protein [Alishewanella longhuensis]